jgi:hypothetical protein
MSSKPATAQRFIRCGNRPLRDNPVCEDEARAIVGGEAAMMVLTERIR